MRRAWPWLLFAGGALAISPSAAACTDAAPCVDAEPMWLSPSAVRFATIADTRSPGLGELAGALNLGFRLKPAVLVVPAPNAAGRDVNLIRHATDVSLGARLGIGSGMELTLSVPAGLYQRGAGIKGVTHQSAPPIAAQSLHDARVGFGYALPLRSSRLGGKLRLELGLPLGDEQALAGEASFVASPSLALHAKSGGFFAGLELGARLRRPADFFGSRIGGQALIALGAGYELARPQLAFALESYALPSLVGSSGTRYLPAEWLASTRFTPSRWRRLSFGLAGGSGLPFSADASGAHAGFGVPLFRALAFARFAPGS